MRTSDLIGTILEYRMLMLVTVHMALWGFIPFVCILFTVFSPQRAAMIAFIIGWMFLPNHSYEFPGIPDYNKASACSLSILIASLFFAKSEFSKLKFRAFDVVLVLWCVAPLISSLTNGLGLYNGLSELQKSLTVWAAPYMVGRLYLGTVERLREMAKLLFWSGLIYAPLCVLEMLVSPQLHNWVYGFHPHEFQQSMRGTGYRPVVFMKHGLLLGMWMAMASLLGWQLMRNQSDKERTSTYAIAPLVVTLILIFLACRSFGATALLIAALFALECMRRFKTSIPLLALCLIPVFYMGGRVSGWWTGEGLVNTIRHVNEERSDSLEFRLSNEELLIDKALERPVFGWCGYGRNRVFDDNGEDMTIIDGYWIIVFGLNGLFGTGLFFSLLLGPPLLLFVNYKSQDPLILSLAVVPVMYAIDCMLNDMPSPVYILVIGAFVTLGIQSVKAVVTTQVVESLPIINTLKFQTRYL